MLSGLLRAILDSAVAENGTLLIVSSVLVNRVHLNVE